MQDVLADLNRLNDLWFAIGFKVCLAIFCGGLIGWERQAKHKPAGLRTNMLICLGSCLYTLLSILIGQEYARGTSGALPDPTRIAAQIVTGIGFLGGGMIIQAGGSVSGLTSAATIWVVAAIGVGIGAGYPVMAVTFTLTVYLTLSVLSVLEHSLLGKMSVYRASITVGADDRKSRADVVKVFKAVDFEILQIDIKNHKGQKFIDVVYYCSEQRHKRIEAAIWTIPGVLGAQLTAESGRRGDFFS